MTDAQKRIKLNVGAQEYETTLSTLTYKYPNSLLANMFVGNFKASPDETGVYFIDRDGTLFGYILNFLRDDDIALPSTDLELAQLEREAKYYGLDDLQRIVEEHRATLQQSNQRNRLTTQIYYPQSSGTGFSQLKGYSYSSGSGFGLDSSSLASAYSSLSYNEGSKQPTVPTGPDNDPAGDLFAPSASSSSTPQNSNFTNTTPHNSADGPFGPPLTSHQHAPNFFFTSDMGPFGPPISDLLFPDDIPTTIPDLSTLNLSSDEGDGSGF
eukprot:TRINITY_DN9412_c0_g1_i1.p1 TRINITY_DN9412_c0_g1~~TRINITY_DN9412_c0_g1_i1.p1  ORF type:complete len:297 (-),score=50.20 TRINITY_DN9412_c0_g1_i1:27-830(-)